MTTYQIKVQREYFKIQSTIYIYMYMYKPWALPPQKTSIPQTRQSKECLVILINYN